MLFIIKKIISAFLLPLPFIVLILTVGLLLLWFTKKQKSGKIIITIGLFLLIVLGLRPVTDRIILPLENSFPKYVKTQKIPDVKYIAVLGAGQLFEKKVPVSSYLPPAAIFRLIEGIRIYKENQGSKLIFSGYGGSNKISCAEVMAEVAELLGVPEKDIIQEPDPKDTHDEAIAIHKIVNDEPFVLVTSAAHMKRSVLLFKKQGMNPIPAPTDYLARQKVNFHIPLPNSGSFRKVESAIHEYLGIIWAKIRGFI